MDSMRWLMPDRTYDPEYRQSEQVAQETRFYDSFVSPPASNATCRYPFAEYYNSPRNLVPCNNKLPRFRCPSRHYVYCNVRKSVPRRDGVVNRRQNVHLPTRNGRGTHFKTTRPQRTAPGNRYPPAEFNRTHRDSRPNNALLMRFQLETPDFTRQHFSAMRTQKKNKAKKNKTHLTTELIRFGHFININ